MLDLMTRKDFNELLTGERGHYYQGRWDYFSAVIEIIESLKVNKIIEIGPGLLPIVKNADIILSPEEDHFGRPENLHGEVIVHDITTQNWPIESKKYDLLIALQVWEHLDNKQSRAFREVQRIAKSAILSFPYHWTGGENKPSHRAHRDIDKQLIADWSLGIEPKSIIEIGRTGPEFSKGPRIIYFWEF